MQWNPSAWTIPPYVSCEPNTVTAFANLFCDEDNLLDDVIFRLHTTPLHETLTLNLYKEDIKVPCDANDGKQRTRYRCLQCKNSYASSDGVLKHIKKKKDHDKSVIVKKKPSSYCVVIDAL